jgi:hypothetical protein
MCMSTYVTVGLRYRYCVLVYVDVCTVYELLSARMLLCCSAF